MQRLREAVHKGGGTLAGPNKALHLTAYSVRSCVAPASGSRSPPAFGSKFEADRPITKAMNAEKRWTRKWVITSGLEKGVENCWI